MIRILPQILLVAIFCLLPRIAPLAQLSEYDRVQLVNERRLLMFEMQRAYWVLLDVQREKSSEFGDASDAAGKIADHVMRSVTLMEPGTAKGETPGSRARPEVWTEAGDFMLAAESLRDAALALSQSAKTEDLAEYKVKFDGLTEACIQCHDFTPSSGGRFRFAKGE